MEKRELNVVYKGKRKPTEPPPKTQQNVLQNFPGERKKKTKKPKTKSKKKKKDGKLQFLYSILDHR